MTTTTNYGYTVVVGTDSPVNIQNDIAPNFTAIDTDLKAVSDSAITDATHTVTGTVHALVRTDADRSVFYFVATGDMVAGDTFTVDGVSVTARLANGEALGTGSFKINNTVMCILVGSVLNLMVYNSVTIPTPTAFGVTYDNTGSGLSATNVQDAIDEVVTMVNLGSITVTADGVRTYAQILAELYVTADHTKFRKETAFELGNLLYHASAIRPASIAFTYTGYGSGKVQVGSMVLATNAVNCSATDIEISSAYTTTDATNLVPSSGTKFTITY